MADISTCDDDTDRIKACFDAVIDEIKAVRIIPNGASEPLPPIPNEVEISEHDLERAAALWDELMPEYAGLLMAQNTSQVPRHAA